MELKSRLLFVLDAHLDPPQMVARTPVGERKIVTVNGGTFEGPRLRGRILPAGGADWALVRNDGSLVLDVRLTLETDDGERIFMTYRGVRHGPAEVLARLARGEPVDPAAYYFRTAPFFETGSEKYAWLNRIVAVGVGERTAKGPRYTVFEIL
jgi:hypothetical protein